MKIKEIISYLEEIAPLNFQESYDNSGLIVGDANQEVHKALVSLDCTENVLDDAIAKGCNLIIAHHPIVFSGLKKFTGSNYVERTVIKAIQNNIALYAIHTNLDNVIGGVSSKIAQMIELENQAILRPKKGLLKKLTVFVPRTHLEQVREALFAAGAGKLGDYDQCSFNTAGYGTFRPLSGAVPHIGKIDENQRVEETKIEVIMQSHMERKILVSMLAAHPYEEVSYQVITMDNPNQYVGSGAIGNLKNPMPPADFFKYLKEKLKLNLIRHTQVLNKPISRVAVCGGAGGFLLEDAKRSGADIFITADYKYHEFFDAQGEIIIADIGHFESEQFTQNLVLDLIEKRFPDFAVLLTDVNTNPIHYYS